MKIRLFGIVLALFVAISLFSSCNIGSNESKFKLLLDMEKIGTTTWDGHTIRFTSSGKIVCEESRIDIYNQDGCLTNKVGTYSIKEINNEYVIISAHMNPRYLLSKHLWSEDFIQIDANEQYKIGLRRPYEIIKMNK